MRLLLATQQGLLVAEMVEDDGQIREGFLDTKNITSVIAREGAILAGSTDGIFASTNGGKSWHESNAGLDLRHVRWLAFHPDISDLEFAGTEPAGLFVSTDGGGSWRSCDEVTRLRDLHGWWLPYSPEGGCVRGFAFHGSRAYAAVEVGAALRSDDYGQKWRLAGGSDGRPEFGTPEPGLVHPDVHSVEVHPSSPDLIRAPTGGGLYGSEDGGESWTRLHGARYARAIWLDPDDSSHMVLGPSDGASGKNGRIEETFNGGANWLVTSQTWNRNMVERFVPLGDVLFAVMANGQLLRRSHDESNWTEVFAGVAHIQDVATIP